MSPFAITVLALSMSIDAFAVSVGRGAALNRPRFSEALRTGVVFGVVEAITPVIGWAAGVAASSFVEAVDHWIAFGLLAGVGLHMLFAAVWKNADQGQPGSSFAVLMATAVGTSLDAMAVGVSLAFLEVDIFTIAIAIGLATFQRLLQSGARGRRMVRPRLCVDIRAGLARDGGR
ncbi:manganese efflux pump MntP family protein [Hyphomicrobium sp. ghe19]|uniref:manganese efflux pump MntP n=1 Tax=Hyphomicrobium sp. ghe19 TaxID=2682968 RepID=UPI0013670023|nr:putative manganese efflux pump MntP [Hyphomicrobium sp. ghe19]